MIHGPTLLAVVASYLLVGNMCTAVSALPLTGQDDRVEQTNIFFCILLVEPFGRGGLGSFPLIFTTSHFRR